MPSALLRYYLTREYPHFSLFLLNLLFNHPISSLQGLINEYTISADPTNTINNMSDKHRAFHSNPLFQNKCQKSFFLSSDLVLTRGNRYLEDPKLIDDIDRHIEKSKPTCAYIQCIAFLRSPFPISRTVGFTHIHIIFFHDFDSLSGLF